MYEIGVVGQFEAAHQLKGDFGPAARMHGHTYRLEVIVRGDALDELNVLFDIGRLRTRVDDLVDRLSYRDLNEVEGLEAVNTTAEAVAKFCWDALASGLTGSGLSSLAVRVWESPQVWAGLDAPLKD